MVVACNLIFLEVVDVKSAKSQRLSHIFLAKHFVCPHVGFFPQD